MVLGGGLLVALGALLAFVPRRGGAIGFPFAAAVVLGTLYLVPAMQRDTPNQFLAGGVFTVLLVLFLWLERVERRSAPLAAGAVATAIAPRARRKPGARPRHAAHRLRAARAVAELGPERAL